MADDTPPAGGRDEPAGGSGTDAGPTEAARGGDGQPAGGEDARGVLFEVFADPAGTVHRLPAVLGQLESDEQSVRLRAAAACCLIAVESDDERVVEYLVRRLSDRLTDDEVSLELTVALDYLSSSFAGQVEPVLAELSDTSERVPLPRVGNFTRNYYYGQGPGRAGVGRLRVAGAETPETPAQVVADRQREERQRVARERAGRQREDEEGAGTGGPDGRADEHEPGAHPSGEESFAGNPAAAVRRTRDVSAIAVRSRFDELHVLGERHSGRYATTYEALVGEGSDQRAVALRLLDRPSEGVTPQFDRALAEQLGRWEAASDHDNVVTVLDWGVEAEPWVATALIDGMLAERDRPSLAVAFRNALSLADAVSHLHGAGVVHGGLDPGTVVYPGERFDDAERGPLLNNVGLINVFRYYVEPANCLDPRYAAPEFYDDRFGRVDHATDVYQLGAVFYRLFTGRPPVTGEFEDVRQAVLSGPPPTASSVVDGLPAELDDLLAKTMAGQKLRRYETVEQLRGELASLADDYG